MKKRWPDGDGITDEPNHHGDGFQTIAGSGDITVGDPSWKPGV